MTPGDRWQRVQDLFHAALERPAEARGMFLRGACGDDDDLRREVEALLAPQAEPHPPTLSPGSSLGSYRILNPLGAGGMGEVYRARDTRLGREVAVKILPKELRGDADRLARFDREARVLASLNHPNIAALFGLDESRGTPYLVMELVQGETLAARLLRGALPLRQALQVGRQIAEALEAAHAKGVIHRDLKPANVAVTPEGRVKVLDFGLAKAFQDGRSSSSRPESPTLTSGATREGIVLGTPAYMSPEQARGEALDQQTDVWSFGCLLYEALTGRRAFEGKTTSDTIVAVLEREPDWGALPATTFALRSLLQRCTQKDKQRRLHDIADARIELEEALAASVSSTPFGASSGERPRRWRGMAAALVAFVVVLGSGYSLRARLSPRSPGSPTPTILAVLPFHVVTDSEAKGDLGVGLADDITTRLGNFADLRVRPTRSVLSYQGPGLDVQQAGRALKADSVLSGTVRKVAGGYRVSVQLVRVADGAIHWAESYDVATRELLGLEDYRISEKVTSALGIQVTAEEKAKIFRRYTANAAAYEAYLRGRAHLLRSTADGTAAAVQAFEEALRLDPSYAQAFAALSMASAEMHLRFAPASEVQAWGERAKREAQRALSLDANLPETHQALAAVYGKTDFEWERVIEESRRAVELNPRLDLPYSDLGRAFYHLGLLELADKNLRAALALDPETRGEPLRSQGIVALLAGRFAEAVRLLEEVQRISGKPFSDFYLAQAYYYKGETKQAEAVLEELSRAARAADSARARSTLAGFLAASGERTRAADLVREVTAQGYTDHHVAYGLGAACAQLGRFEEAVVWLRRAADTGFPCHPWYVRDPLLGPFKGRPEFERFVQELQTRLRAAQDRYGER